MDIFTSHWFTKPPTKLIDGILLPTTSNGSIEQNSRYSFTLWIDYIRIKIPMH